MRRKVENIRFGPEQNGLANTAKYELSATISFSMSKIAVIDQLSFSNGNAMKAIIKINVCPHPRFSPSKEAGLLPYRRGRRVHILSLSHRRCK